MTNFVFRKAIYPLLIESDTCVCGIENEEQLHSVLIANSYIEKNTYQIIDASGEGWSYTPEIDVISPLSINKRWTKNNIIDFYNAHSTRSKTSQLTVKSLSNKKVAQIITEIISHDKLPSQ